MNASPKKQPQLLGYQPASNSIDEAFGKDGKFVDHWAYLLKGLEGLGFEELTERHRKAMRILRDDGASYNIYNRQDDQSWQMDLVPFLIPSSEWSEIELGLQERAELFDLILKDLYGERELITRGILPPEVVFGHKSFLRACHNIRLPGENQLIIHATDMMRQPDGAMRILADRTQAPSGAGYALENRTVMSRVLPSLFRDSHVHRLASYFQVLRQTLIDLVPNVASPQIVVLTPGSYNETYFEHSYLANYLGFSLVQSNDLVVRNGFVWMKSLDGLNRVDVILRRVDDYFCDPVELKGDSQLGVPGLLEVVRNGNVAVANPLGSGILENPVLLRFLPQISRHFLGRELRLDSVQSWWCGITEDHDFVCNNLDDLVIKSVFRTPFSTSVVAAELDNEQRNQLLASIAQRPGNFIAQQKLSPSSMPVFDGAQLSSRPVLLRTFSVASEGSYRVMPGGLTRAGVAANSSLIANQLGSISKDTWVLASEPEKQAGTWPQIRLDEDVDQTTSLPRRVVENLFWMGRYSERAESVLRLLRAVFLQVISAAATPENARRLLLQAVTRLSASYPGFIENSDQQLSPQQELLDIIRDPNLPGSVQSCINALLNCAEESKGMFSSDGQRVINEIGDQMRLLSNNFQSDLLTAPEETLNPLVDSFLALAGIVQESMIRGLGWRFIDMGRRLERSLQTTNLLRSTLLECLDSNEEAVVLESLLTTVEELTSYRRRYRGSLGIRNSLELTLLDSANPRSIIYQLEKISEHVNQLPLASDNREMPEEQRLIFEAVNLVKLSRLDNLASPDEQTKRRNQLDQLLSRLFYLLSETSNLLSERFFEHEAAPRQLVEHNWSVD